jgi:flagellar biosynthesis/type III secretory pathway protein FliH
VREASLEKLASFCGPEAVSPWLPRPPSLDEPPPADLPLPPDDSAKRGRWVRDVAELAEARAREGELRGREAGLREGEAKGKAEGLREGEARGLRAAVLDLGEAFGVELTGERRAQIEAMGVSELEALRRELKHTRCWPA